MQKIFNKIKRKHKGFTLTEVLVVVAIVGILAVLALPLFGKHLEQTREKTDIDYLANARALAETKVLHLFDPDYMDGVYSLTFYYDITVPKLADSRPTEGYGQGTSKDGESEAYLMGFDEGGATKQYLGTDDVQGKIIGVRFLAPRSDGEAPTFYLFWDEPGEELPAIVG